MKNCLKFLHRYSRIWSLLNSSQGFFWFRKEKVNVILKGRKKKSTREGMNKNHYKEKENMCATDEGYKTEWNRIIK